MRKRKNISPLLVLAAAGLLCLAVLCGCAVSACLDGGQKQASSGSASASSADPASSASRQQDGPDTSARPEEPGQTEEDPALPDQSGSGQKGQDPDGQTAAAYDFSSPAPESDPVDNSYFQDAAFIGDSRTDGFLLYSGIGCGENLTSNGLSIFKLGEKKAVTIDGKKYTLLEALALKEYGKVYLSLGINELGYYDDQGFYEAYCQAIDTIRACQPNAVIYIQGLIPLNEDVIAATGGASYLTNEHLLIYNDLMKQAAREKQVVFLDLNPAFTGSDGQLPADASKDGVHLTKPYCQQWLEYLKTHTVDRELLFPAG